MHHPMKLFFCSLIALGLVGCGGGGSSDEPVIINEFFDQPPDTSGLVSKMETASPTNSIDFYLLPDSDDSDNIPQDPLNPLTQAKLNVGKFIYHDAAFATEGVALRAKT